MWITQTTADKDQILAFLQTDRSYAAYAIGDLEPGLFEQSTYVVAQQSEQTQALALHYRGLRPPALFLMGDRDGLCSVITEALHPQWVYLTCREEHLGIASTFYKWEDTTPMWRMALQLDRFQPFAGECVRLSEEHSESLAELYALGGGQAFGPAQVPNGVFYGVFTDSQLVAAAGTHLASPTYGVAGVGNIFTHADHRRRGHAAATTTAVVQELLNRGIQDIVLNVAQDNTAAITLYKRMGFEHHCPFFEGQAIYRWQN